MTNYKEEVYETFFSGLESNRVVAVLNGYDEEGIKKELDEVYQKAKAWDKYKAHMESHIAGEVNEEELVSDLKSDYFESEDN